MGHMNRRQRKISQGWHRLHKIGTDYTSFETCDYKIETCVSKIETYELNTETQLPKVETINHMDPRFEYMYHRLRHIDRGI